MIEVYAPLFAGQHEVVGAYEVYADAEPLEQSIASRKRTIWIASAMLFAILWVLLMLLARNASECFAARRRPPRALRLPQRVLPHARGEPSKRREPERDRRGG